ncbi:regulator of gene activity isoform X2 [Phlebotomus papatasi]|uniref:regulator of gene activity isoform X2 n=1 Tax=Phlebotomus papatasi TaxID=29031 RepID=UPI002483465C|nr:regulator of gene activity isoform X2 [Phlebotomus papatasi]
MANLNFQQPPRSIASASLTGRSTGSFGANSLSGHVTPTSGMFPPGSGASSYGQSQQPQLSPNRSAQQLSSVGGVPPQMSNSSRSSLFGQRAFADRRAMAGLGGPMSNMGSFMQSSRGYGSQSGSGLNNFHSVFGGGGRDAGTPPLLDLSEFPSLTNSRGQSDGGSQQTSSALQPPGSKPYVGMVKQPTSEQSEFQMSSEDFPALPGTQVAGGAVGGGPGGVGAPGGGDGSGEKGLIRDGGQMVGGQRGAAGMGMELQSDSLVGGVTEKAMKRGVQTSPDGKVTNIPASMVNNQFGMVGLLTFIRAAESDPNLVSLAMGQDLTTLGLNLNSPENLYPAFGGPFSDQPCRPQDIDFHVPPEYLVNMSIRDKLAQPVLKKYKDDLLFFLFYTNVGDVMQLAAAAELHSREWRYHIEEKVWISRLPGMNNYDTNGTTERGTYYYFDAQNWRRVVKDLQIDTGKLDKCPNLNAIVSLSGQPV